MFNSQRQPENDDDRIIEQALAEVQEKLTKEVALDMKCEGIDLYHIIIMTGFYVGDKK